MLVRQSRGEELAVPERAPLDAALRWSPAQLAFKRQAARRLTVLAYHGVRDADRFQRQLDHLAGTMRPVSLDQVIEATAGRAELPRRAVLITFDDGERSVLETAAPLLGQRGLPAVAFVVAGLLDTDEPFWWAEVEQLVGRGASASRSPGSDPRTLVQRLKRAPDEERLAVISQLRRASPGPRPRMPQLRSDELPALEAAGIVVGNHTFSHPCLPRCGEERLRSEIDDAHHLLGEALGHEPRAFAYPNGDWDGRAERLLADRGYAVAFLFDHRVSPMTPSHRLRISRVRVNSHTGLDRFAVIVSGLHPALHHARGRS
jgi:peptidoglycan/xylan/chitin deacetylase (PgdA/CDA1 family)